MSLIRDSRVLLNCLSMSFFMEFKRRLNVVQVVVHLPNDRYTNGCEVRVKKSCISFETQDSEVCYNLPHQFEVNPTSCHGLSWKSNAVCGELHLRLRLNESSQILLPPVGDDGDLPSFMPNMHDIKTSRALYCSRCGHEIETTIKGFDRVLPLPSSSWSEMSSNLFCCNHGKPKSVNQLSMSPRSHDCLVGDFSCIVHRDALKVASEGPVCCTRCHGIFGWPEYDMGQQSKTALKIDLSAVCFDNPYQGNGIDSVDWEKFFVRQLCSQKRLHTSYKFLIESRNADGKLEPKLLVWLFDSNTEVAYHSFSADSVNVVPSPVLKILFKTCFDDLTLREAECWCKDMAVTTLEFPEMYVMRLVQLLTRGTSLLPPSFRCLDGFCMGLLNR